MQIDWEQATNKLEKKLDLVVGLLKRHWEQWQIPVLNAFPNHLCPFPCEWIQELYAMDEQYVGSTR